MMSIVDLLIAAPGNRSVDGPAFPSRHGRRLFSPRRHDWVEYSDVLGSRVACDGAPPTFAENHYLSSVPRYNCSTWRVVYGPT